MSDSVQENFAVKTVCRIHELCEIT